MRKYHWVAALLVILFAGLFAFGCGVKATPPTPATLTVPTPTTPVPTPPATVVTTPPPGAEVGPAQQFSDEGKLLYATNCARCHGVDGQGSARLPALMGPKISLAKYNTGQGLLDYVSKQMPLGAGGSLSQQLYTRLVVYLMVQNGYISSAAEINSSKLDQVTLTPK